MDSALVESILAQIDDDEVIAFEQALVRIPSYTTEETPLATFIVGRLREAGLPAELQEVRLADGRTSHNVMCSIAGSGGGRSLLLFGHMDHGPILGRAFAEDMSSWRHDPWAGEVEQGWLYGKGSQDDKGGVCGLVMAAIALHRAGFTPRGDIYFCPVQGHKRVSSGTLHLLRSGIKPDYAINTENTGSAVVPIFVGRMEGKVHIRMAKPEFELHFHTKDRFPELLRGRRTVMEQTMTFLRALGAEMEAPRSDPWLTFRPHPDLPGYPQHRFEMIEFRGLGHLTVSIQIRTVPGMTDETVRRDLERVITSLQAADPHFRAELEWPSWETRPAVDTPFDSPAVQSLARWHEYVVGAKPDVGYLGRSGAAADGSHTFGAGIPTVLYGPGGGQTDLEREWSALTGAIPREERIATGDLVSAARVYALTAADLCG